MRLSCVIIMAGGLLSAGCFESGAVSGDSIIRRLPIAPDGVWHDLEALAMDGRGPELRELFSRRYLLRIADPHHEPLTYEEDYEDYHRQVETLNAELLTRTVELTKFSDQVCSVVRSMSECGAFVTAAPMVPKPKYTDERSMPRGPNTAELFVRYWSGEPGMGEPQAIRVHFVQEFDDWRIDAITPDIFQKRES